MSGEPKVGLVDIANADSPLARFVVLGASNVHLGLPTIVSVARSLAGGPIDFLAALGHGRSFGRPSSIPGRTLPAITECRLWADLADRPSAPTHALITDIGNDLLYGRSPRTTAAWVADCAARLAAVGPVTLTALPVDNLATLGAWRYRAFRTLFFPGLRMTLRDLADRANELNERVQQLADQQGYGLVPLSSDWYGLDPIHYRVGSRSKVWRTLLSAAIKRSIEEDESPSANHRSFQRVTALERMRLYQAAAAERSLFGVRRVCSQPCVALRDGTRVSLY